ncbi:MAG TPA: LuxR C-terminal-related transcriptional regulator [Terriglobales bacterium]|nr:LuxR C-terminal-related transcriptional regulator [Terriglobales bacterium]
MSPPVLSDRQLKVAEFVATGYSNRDIAKELSLTEQIVKNVVHSLFDKLGVWNRVELANRFAGGALPGIAESRRQIESGRSGQLLQPKILDARTERVFSQGTNGVETGMELRDLLEDPEFPLRKKRQREKAYTSDAYRTVARVFADTPDVILQHVVDAATTFCGADSAGISLEESDENGERRFRWIAISGSFAPFLGGTTPRFFSPCGTTLDSGRAQLYRVGKTYYDYLGIKADPITDGILIPWQAGEIRGTIWAVSHRHREAFDVEDFELIDGLADFAAVAVENRCHQGK